MATDVVMPALEMAQDTGKLVHWLKAEGELVKKDEPLMEIETDKVTVEIESPGTGILANVAAQPGDEVPVGQIIALLLAEGEATQESKNTEITPEDSPDSDRNLIPATPVARRIAAEHGFDLGQISSVVGADRIRKEDVLAYMQEQQSLTSHGETSPRFRPASPKARRLASEQGLDLDSLTGSGPDSAIVAGDVQTALADADKRVLMARPLATTDDEYTVIPIQGARKVIAERLQASYQTAPHISLSLAADMTETLRISDRLLPAVQSETGHPLTMTAIMAKIIGATLRDHPRLNAHLVDGEIREFSTVHLGIAVALDDGLIVPVIRSVEQRGLSSIQTELHDLTERARMGSLKLHEVKGGTFTLSNLGMFGVEQFTAILNPPEVGILSVGAVRDIPVGVKGQVVLCPMMQVTINADHRAVDGAVAAAFLSALKEALENPWLLLT